MQFKLPELGEGVHEGELVSWKVKVGDSVKYDQSLCEIMTDKATVEIPSAFQGKVAELHVKEGQMVSVGQLMLSFQGAEASKAGGATAASGNGKNGSHSEQSSEAAASAASAKASPKPASTDLAVAAASDVNVATRALAAPSTRKLAREMGVALTQVEGTGPHGRVMREDVQAYTRAPEKATKAAPAPARRSVAPGQQEERVPFKGLRKKISEKMRISKDHAAHFTYVEEADATALVELRTKAKELGAKQGIKVTYLPFIMKAMVAALRHYPILNSSLDEEKGEIVFKNYFNIGLSIQTDDGLMAPVVKDVAGKSILELAQEIQALVERARSKKLTMDDLQGGTITLTNVGSIGGLFATPIINYPEVAIVGFNKIFRKPVVKTVNGKEEIVIRDWTYFSISLDHRVVDGAIGAEFMKQVIDYVEHPSLLLLESL